MLQLGGAVGKTLSPAVPYMHPEKVQYKMIKRGHTDTWHFWVHLGIPPKSNAKMAETINTRSLCMPSRHHSVLLATALPPLVALCLSLLHDTMVEFDPHEN